MDIGQLTLRVLISILAVLADRDGLLRPGINSSSLFQSSRSLRTATNISAEIVFLSMYFNPRGPCGPRRLWQKGRWQNHIYFNPRGPCGPRPAAPLTAPTEGSYFNPRGPCGPRLLSSRGTTRGSYFNPRGPCGPRPLIDNERIGPKRFQSSRSLRTATRASRIPYQPGKYFNPRGPCGPRRFQNVRVTPKIVFQSSRSLRTATRNHQETCDTYKQFQSSRSLRTATTTSRPIPTGGGNFNPRGPCGPRPDAEGGCLIWRYFNPRGPCGPRRNATGNDLSGEIFQSSRSLRTATPAGFHAGGGLCISILAVLADRDWRKPVGTSGPWGFQSLRSLRTATTAVVEP